MRFDLQQHTEYLMMFSTGLHVFPTFVLYELTILLVLTVSLVIMKVIVFISDLFLSIRVSDGLMKEYLRLFKTK